MLQIIGGKFFRSQEEKYLHITPCKEVIYSNICFLDKIETSIFTIEPVHIHREINTYIISFNNKIEKQPGGGIISTGEAEIATDILVCLTFYFNGIFMKDINYLKELLRERDNVTGEKNTSRQMLPSILKVEIGGRNRTDIEGFGQFIDTLCKLKRTSYEQVMKAIRQYYNSILLLNVNKDLAYTSLVTIGESLAQEVDGYESEWEDCDIKLAQGLNPILERLAEGDRNAIKSELLKHMHTKLAARYHDYFMSKIDDSYFIENAIGVGKPCVKGQLSRAIKNAYSVRSKYVHELRCLPKEIQWQYVGEICSTEKGITLTFEGLVRLNRFVILKTIETMESVEKEDINYFKLLPGVINVAIAPQYWIWKDAGYNIQSADDYLEGFFQVLEPGYFGKEVNLPDLDVICEKIKDILKGMNGDSKKKIPLVVFLMMYNKLRPKEGRVCGKISRICEEVMGIPDIQTIAYYLFFEGELPSDISILEELFDDYMKKKYTKSKFRFPKALEAEISCLILNTYLENKEVEKYHERLKDLIGEYPGNQYLVGILKQFEESKEILEVEVKKIFGIDEEKSTT